MLKVLMLFTVLTPEGDFIATTDIDVSLIMSYEECVVSAPNVAETLRQYYGSIKYQRVNIISGCTEE